MNRTPQGTSPPRAVHSTRPAEPKAVPDPEVWGPDDVVSTYVPPSLWPAWTDAAFTTAPPKKGGRHG